MTTEIVLLLFIYAVILLGVFQKGITTFRSSAPQLAARVERNISTGRSFKAINGRDLPGWDTPEQ